MKRAVYRVQYIGESWQIRGPGVTTPDRWHAAKTTAVHAAASLARSRWQTFGQLGQVVIHGKDGRIQSERTYGKDPRRHRG